MTTTICRPCITLRNGKRLCAYEVGRKAFCFEVDEVRSENVKNPSLFSDQDEFVTKKEKN